MIANYPPKNAEEARQRIIDLLVVLDETEKELMESLQRGLQSIEQIKLMKIYYSGLVRPEGGLTNEQ